MNQYCEKLTGALQGIQGARSWLCVCDSREKVSERVAASCFLKKDLAAMYEYIAEKDPYFLWQKYGNGEAVWEGEYDESKATRNRSWLPHPKGIITFDETKVYLNGKEIGDYSEGLNRTNLGSIDVYTHPKGYMVVAGPYVWINGVEQSVNTYGSLDITAHPQGFVRRQGFGAPGFPEPGFYLNDSIVLKDRMKDRMSTSWRNNWWFDKRGRMYVEVQETIEHEPGREINIYCDGVLVESVMSDEHLYRYHRHPEGYMKTVDNKEVYLNKTRKLYNSLNLGTTGEVMGYPGGMILRLATDVPGRSRFVFYNGSHLGTNQLKNKESFYAKIRNLGRKK